MLKDSAELLEGRMNFIQKFLQKKYAWGIVFFVLIGFGIGAYFRGVDDGKKNAKEEIASLVNTSNYKSVQIDSLRKDVLRSEKNALNYKTLYDNCSSSLSTQDLNAMVKRKLDEAESLKKILERNNTEDKKFNQTIKNALKQ